MLSLISNENFKIYIRLRTWILTAIVVAAIIVIAVILHAHQHPNPNWKAGLMAQNAKLQQAMSSPHLPKDAVQQYRGMIAVNNYEIAHNLDPNLDTAWKFTATAMNLSSLLVAFIVVIVGDIVAGEFGGGTIKMLLTQTATRTKVLVSKYIAALLFALGLTAVMLGVSLLSGGLFFGFGGGGLPFPYVNPEHVAMQMSTSSYVLMQYGFLFVQVIMNMTIAFMISAIFRSTALAITISILAYLVGNTLVSVLANYYSWVKYILFSNVDLSKYVIGGPLIHGMTLGFSITMLVIYFVVMNGLAWFLFVKRDVALT